ncbi:23 kDa integral membrane protein-like [Brevipalpus obovatus]|uniref:23 kDa integral membrane protein-like n=1 Tax=Brevipalpus obovatus TaxID=246614 RepID=UPI003D9E01A4
MGFYDEYFSCCKVCLVFFNFILFCIGMVLLSLGLWFRIDPKMYEPPWYLETDNIMYAGWLMLFSGIAVVIIAFVGCCGVLSNSTAKLGGYMLCMGILVALAIAGCILACTYGFGDRLEWYVTQQVMLHIQRRPFSPISREILDFLQVKLHCCGAYNFNDYHRFGQQVPVSCYRSQANFISTEGCGRVLGRFYDLRAGLALGFNIMAGLVEVLCIVSGLSVFCALRNSEWDS